MPRPIIVKILGIQIPSGGGVGLQAKTIAIGSDFTFTPIYFDYLVDATAATITGSLPPAVGSGQMYRVKKIDSTSNVVTIAADGTDLIDDSISVNLVDQWSDCVVVDAAFGYWDAWVLGGGETVAFTDLTDCPNSLTGEALKVVSVKADETGLEFTAGAAAPWGSITGTLSDQTDLQSALDAKENSLGFTPENVANKDISGSLGTSDTAYPSQKAVKTYADTKVPETRTVNGHALSADVTVTASDIGLGSVTNDAQTKAAIVPNTAPSTGQVLAGNAGGTAYAPVTVSGSGATMTCSSAGVITISAIANASLANSAITIAGASTALGSSVTLDTITGVASNGFLKRTGANALTNVTAIDLSGSDATGTLAAGRFPALTGDVTTSAGSLATAVKSDLALPGNPTTTTQSASDNSTKIATTAYVDAAAKPSLFYQVMSATPTSASTGLTTWVNQGSASVANNATGLTIWDVSGGSDNLRCRSKSSPSTPYTITALVAITAFNLSGNFHNSGIGWYDGTKLSFISIGYVNPNIVIQGTNYSNVTTFNSSLFTAYIQQVRMIWLRLTDNGTNISVGFSNDGSFFQTAYTVAKASGYLGSSGYSNVVFLCNPLNADIGATLMSWTQA